jgi:hypothetical protein
MTKGYYKIKPRIGMFNFTPIKQGRARASNLDKYFLPVQQVGRHKHQKYEG